MNERQVHDIIFTHIRIAISLWLQVLYHGSGDLKLCARGLGIGQGILSTPNALYTPEPQSQGSSSVFLQDRSG